MIENLRSYLFILRGCTTIRPVTSPIHHVGLGLTATAAIAALAVAFGSSANRVAAEAPPSSILPKDHYSLASARNVDAARQTAILPLHRGVHNGQTVWFIMTDASEMGVARDLNIMYSPKLANMAIGCAECVQTVALEPVLKDNKFAEAVVSFPGIPDFSPARVWNPGTKGFPPLKAQPGGVGDSKYSPFIRIAGSNVVYNAPIVAVGNGPFDFVHHTNTQDHVIAMDTTPDYNEDGPEVTMQLTHGYDSGQPILYLSTEASDPVAATLERATYVPLLQKAPFLGGDDFIGSARERIFAVANGPRASQASPANAAAQTGQPQGFTYVSLDGHLTGDATPNNTASIRSSNNIQGDFPIRSEPRHEFSYSPLWDVQVGEWTPQAIAQGKAHQLNDENEMLAAVKAGLMTGPMGAKFGSAGFVVNCPPIAYIAEKPTADTTMTTFQQIP